MGAQETILRACQHPHRPCEVNMGRGEVIHTCADCYNASVDARRRERKNQLAVFWNDFRAKQEKAMREANAHVGQRVSYFCPSMLGGFFGGLTLTGRIVLNRNLVAIVKLDRPYNGQKSCQWHNGWKEVQSICGTFDLLTQERIEQ